MNEMKGLFVGAGGLVRENFQTGEVTEKPRIALSDGGPTALPRLMEADADTIRAAQAIRVGQPVIVTFVFNRYNQAVVKSIKPQAA